MAQLYNPLSQLAYMPKLDLTPISDMVKEQQLQKQQKEEFDRLGVARDKLGVALGNMYPNDPMKGQLLSAMTDYNPQMAMNYIQNQQRAQSQGGMSAYQQQQISSAEKSRELKGRIIQNLEAQKNANDEQLPKLQAEYNSLVIEHDSIPFLSSDMRWKGSPSERMALEKAKEARNVAKESREEGAYTLTQAKGNQEVLFREVDNWQKTNKNAVENMDKLNKISVHIPQAKAGNPQAGKNLVAMMSRMGSNEALSDSELALMLSSNMEDKLKGMYEKFIKGGSSVTQADVENAIKLYNSLINEAKGNFDESLNFGVSRLKKRGIDNEEEARRLLVGSLEAPNAQGLGALKGVK